MSPAAVRWFADAVDRGMPLASSRLLGTELTRVSRREQLALDRRDGLAIDRQRDHRHA